ncbi:M23 family metallopeptidase [Falsiroseomonas selenitidurans]|uniref:M23 family metallopeptidase n=1 Tax=Falsiroseomonas selenitidurans TaxID=2716335 RepID=A0ABX1ECB6_9PROT|nr:M23 family metallopeptidase [Falsiroseomonas selenitidurans]NKC34476.1 M23 family metallopeptidase [Falsiroseomonas selenitidurans]
MISPLRLALFLCAGLAAPAVFAHAEEPPDEAQRIVTVKPGDTLAELLGDAGVDPAEAHAAIAALTPRFEPRRLAVGQEVGLRLDTEDKLLGLEIAPAPGHTITVNRDGAGWLVQEAMTPRLRHLARIETPIEGGVFGSLTRAGLPGPLTHSLIRALSHEVDFQRDVQPGDRIAVAFERLRGPDGVLLGHGQLHYAALTLSGRRMEVWRHAGPQGEVAWFRADGRPLAGGFLRTPLDGARLTSGFGMRRHPVLGYSRRHSGLDFGAPSGTPIYAAADGVVHSARFERGYGRTVRLKHAGGVETVYAHMSRFTRGLRAGARVRQGAVIGAVGSTGMSTGPHLHYEIRIAGRAHNPATVALPAADPLRGPALAGFQRARRVLAANLATINADRLEVALAAE